MIPIKIDYENRDFRDLHFDKIRESIEDLLKKKLNIQNIQNFERESLTWILVNLDLIFLSETNKLREIIQKFDNFINMYNNEIFLSLSNIKLKKSNVELKKITVPDLKKICTYNHITPIISKPNKDNYIELIMGITATYIPISDEMKFNLLNKKIKSILSDIFINFYDKEWDKIDIYNRYTFVIKHNLKTCPYCNMGYILVSQKDENNKNGLRPEIDHFFPKSKYPYLAMSFYNLIPSCQVCNHTKSNKDTYIDKLLSPYEIDSTTFKLTYIPKNMDFLQIKKRKYNFNSFDIKFKKIDTHSNNYFKLDKLYEQHKDVVLELLIKKTIYSKSYIKELKQNFHFTDDEIYRFLFCNYKKEADLHKRPLSKLTKDISQELGLL
jgi:hypothetical protein